MRTLKLLGEGIPFPFSILYARGARKYFMRFYKEIAEEVASEIEAGYLLDLGTGHGLLPIEIAKIAPNVKITGIDISEDMVRIARKNVKREGVADRVKFQAGDANNLSFDDGSFDFIISTGAMHHWSNPITVFNEAHRVLKYGGKAWIYDLRRDASREKLEKYRLS
ncbi:MAG: class I SAM-dependent methyltransferase [Methanocellales archaeon]|nr:class I SAM-dependent methyltransferase [Methanocellales archaeon]